MTTNPLVQGVIDTYDILLEYARAHHGDVEALKRERDQVVTLLDRIAADRAEMEDINAEWHAQAERAADEYVALMGRHDTAKKRIDALETALQAIRDTPTRAVTNDFDNGYNAAVVTLHEIARRALD